MKQLILSLALVLTAPTMLLAQTPAATAAAQKQVGETKITQTVDSAKIREFQQLEDSIVQKVANMNDQVLYEVNDVRNDLKELRSDIQRMGEDMREGGRVGGIISSLSRNLIPMMPFVAAVLIVFLWLRFSYRKRVMRQDLIYKYVDRGEQVPEWLAKEEANISSTTTNPTTQTALDGVPRKNAKMFLTLAIIFGSIAFIWSLILLNAHGWESTLGALCGAGAFGFVTVWSFRQYLKRTE